MRAEGVVKRRPPSERARHLLRHYHRRSRVDPSELFAYASGVAKRSEAAGKGTQWPTLRQAAKRFRTTLADVEDAIEAYEGEGYMGVVVAFGSANGQGYSEFSCRGACLLEAYK